ncbi:MAG: DsbE family thiol:disulfide interchange protein [Pseudomonadales bacterium]
MGRLKLFLPLIIFSLLALLLLRGLEMDPTTLPTALKDKPFPEFSLLELKDGRMLSVADLKGEVALVNVWATWCVSCRVEHPQLLNLARQGVVIYGVNYKDERSSALAWLARLDDPYKLNISDDDGRLGLDLGVYGAPETYLIDALGVIRYKHVGVVDERVWTDILKPQYEALRGQG